MQVARAFVLERLCGRGRVLVVDLLRVEIALDEPHGVAAEDVDRRVEVHRASVAAAALGSSASMQICAKFASSRKPAAEDFSAWNCTP